MLNIIKSIVLGIIEGITEWLPISSTGHMVLFDALWPMEESASFIEFFLVVIQLGAILAVVMLYWNKIWPLHRKGKGEPFFVKKDEKPLGFIKTFCNNYVHMNRIILWLKILVASIPAAILGFAFDDQIDAMLTGDSRAFVVGTTLIIYGVLFIIIESMRKKEKLLSTDNLPYKTALLIGIMQCLALVPGTSRSGTTILGAILLGCSRTVAAEFSFFLSIPAMAGGSGIKLLKYLGDGNTFSSSQLLILAVGMAVAFIVSVLAIKFLMSYIRKHDFKVFGYYRIILGIIVILYFAFAK